MCVCVCMCACLVGMGESVPRPKAYHAVLPESTRPQGKSKTLQCCWSEEEAARPRPSALALAVRGEEGGLGARLALRGGARLSEDLRSDS